METSTAAKVMKLAKGSVSKPQFCLPEWEQEKQMKRRDCCGSLFAAGIVFIRKIILEEWFEHFFKLSRILEGFVGFIS